MNFVPKKKLRLVKYNLRVMHDTPLHSQDKGSHDTVHPFTGLVNFPRKARSPPTSLGDVRQHDDHLRETAMEMLQILLHCCDEIDALPAS